MPLDPIAFQLGPLAVHWYGIILGVAALAGLGLAVRRAQRIGLDHNILLDFMIYAVPAAIIGARAYYVFFQWDYYAQHPEEIIAVWKGGIAIHGALLGGIVTALLFCHFRRISFWQLADVAAPGLLLGQAIGRWGNFMNQEAHGGPVTRDFLEGLHLPNWLIEQMNIGGVYYHPTFLYESLWNGLGVLLLLWLSRTNPRRGVVFLSYAIWYSVGRFFIEGLRTDSLAFDGPAWLAALLNGLWSPMGLLFEPGAMAYGNVRTAQLVSLLLVLTAVLLLIVRRLRGWDQARYRDVPEQLQAKAKR
ncbi:MAG: prolipoprotein diacylglyceryl transferase [Bacillaceae bacterium G1]|nr:prolipoprotein diacylglyceryl transferase [Bacillota bacterium]OJF17541.1 MAG: prolipoprotein diacylglyceryl transferase [Bacillaceae bacterium G1]